MTLPIDLVIVRHGQSEGNKAKRASEAGDPQTFNSVYHNRHTSTLRLTDLGRSQADQAGKYLRQEFGEFERYVVSEYVRAQETALRLQLPNASWYGNFYLTERDWGSYDYVSAEERKTKFAEEIRMQDIEPFFWSPPNGESLAQLCLRLDRVLHTLHRECRDKKVVMVCHGEVMWGFRVLLERMSQETFKQLHLSTEPMDRIFNCQIFHYTRRDPSSGELSPYANWFRIIRPTSESAWESDWFEIKRPVYSNADLEQRVGAHPAVIY